jgi:YegS/Rv2252/BmrU family lipid kinase
MKVSLIVNPQAGGGRPARCLDSVVARLTDRGLDPVVQPTEGLPHARELARAAAQQGRAAVAFGGDGLIGAVAGALRGTDGVLGVLPGGRGNDFARTLGIAQDPLAACDVLIEGHERRIDLGLVGEHTFVGIASCGFDSVANRIANETRLVRGNLVYAYGAMRALVGWRPVTFTIVPDGQPPRTMTGYTVAAANSPYYGGGMAMAPDATLTDGRLDVVLVADISTLRFLRLLPRVFRGAHVRLPNVEVLRTRSLRISADRDCALYADGDQVARLPAIVSIEPAAIRALVPAVASKALAAVHPAATDSASAHR